MQAVPPTGEQHEIRLGTQRAVVVQVGGALRTYEVGGRAFLDGFDVDEPVTGARGQTLAPWPNRLADGRYRWDDEQHQLPLTEPDRRNAIHGLVRWSSWTAEQPAEHEVTMSHRLHPQPGWPFALDLTITYRLSPDGLSVTTRATNVGGRRCPYGTGAHPYLTVGGGPVDELRLLLRAERYLPTDDRGLPTGQHDVGGTPVDFRAERRIGDTQLDAAFTGLHRDADGLFRTRVTGPDGTVVDLWQDASYPYVELFTGDSLPQRKRRTGLGVEPMTMPPNGLASGEDVVALDPGQAHAGRWGIDPHLR